MTADPDPWSLPGLGRWLDDLARRLDHGIAVLPSDPSRPPGVEAALRAHLRHPPVQFRADIGQSPAAAVADAFGTAPTLEALLNPVLDEELANISLSGIGPNDVAAWSVFLERFAAARASGCAGPALLVTDIPSDLAIPAEAMPQNWQKGLRRGDRVIWAEEHLPATRDGLAGELAVVLAVELCAWRLDLAASLVQASLDDLADPVAWLSRRAEAPILGQLTPCPLAILAGQRKSEIQQRVWKAQLTALFPEIESRRLEIVAMHRGRLSLDDHLRGLGVASIEEIELGALRFQLRGSLNRQEADRLEVLVRARNALAHRQPVPPEDALRLLRN
jgi:hypothetical protein